LGFNLLIYTPGEPGQSNIHEGEDWPSQLRKLIPDIQVNVTHSPGEAMELIGEADAAFGNIVPELFERAGNLKWISCPQAGPTAGYYHQALIDSEVVVTNVRGIYNDYISAHIMAFLLSFARDLPGYFRSQQAGEWAPRPIPVYLPESTALIVGVGGIGGETARLCAQFGITVVGIDARITDPPPGVSELHPPEALDALLPRANFVVMTVPETPSTQGMMGADQFRAMNPNAYLINIGRGATIRLDDLDAALRGGEIAGAALDVFEAEPLPTGHPLWTAPGMLITPHVAAASGPNLGERRTELFMDNCVRFDEGRPLRNVVDKANWF
jgi:phosphoglycerate dehydrogenase-like enzyme